MPDNQTRYQTARAAVNAQTNPARMIRVRRDTLWALLEVMRISEEALDVRERLKIELLKKEIRENLEILNAPPAPPTDAEKAAAAKDQKPGTKTTAKDEDEDEEDEEDEP